MFARAAAYRVQGKNSTTCTTRTDLNKKLKLRNEKPAEKNTSNGILAKNKLPPKATNLFVRIDYVSGLSYHVFGLRNL
jgi:hypothetical protein